MFPQLRICLSKVSIIELSIPQWTEHGWMLSGTGTEQGDAQDSSVVKPSRPLRNTNLISSNKEHTNRYYKRIWHTKYRIF